MIKNLVDLNEALCLVIRSIPLDKRYQTSSRVKILINSMAVQPDCYSKNIQEGIVIIKQMLTEAENKSSLHREISDLNIFLLKLEGKQEELTNNKQSLLNVYRRPSVAGSIINRYF